MPYCDKHNITSNHTCKKCIVEKREATMLQRYGAKSALKCPDIKQKREQTCLERFGNIVPTKVQEVKDKMVETTRKKYGVDYTLQINEMREKGRQTMLEKYNVENALQNKELLQKRNETNIKLFGVENPLQNSEIVKKRKQTNLRIYGKEEVLQVPEIQEQIRNTMTEIYGAPNPLQCPSIKQKKDNTCEEKYGDKDIMRNSEIFEKVINNSYKRKDYILPSGKKIMYQGYENVAFNELLQTMNENDFINDVKLMPTIMYEYNGKMKRYYPDIYLPSQNRFIEVKSDYTFKRYLSQNIAKQSQMFKDGYLFEFWICTTKAVVQKITTPILTEINIEEK
jgi:hypothetical protein